MHYLNKRVLNFDFLQKVLIFDNKMNHMTKNLIICTLALLYACLGYCATSKYTIKQITNANGLSNSSVNVICQDRNTLMWFGTWDGLDKWDSQRMRVYLPTAGESGSIGNNVIRDIVVQNDTCIWVVTDRGVDRYNPAKDRFTNYFTGATERTSVSEDSFHLAISPDGDVFCLVNGRGLYVYEDNDFRMRASIRGRRILKVFFDIHSNLWTYTANGELYRGNELCATGILFVYYDALEDQIWIQDTSCLRKYGSSEAFPFKEGQIRACVCDGASLFLGTSEGVYEIELLNGSCSRILDNIPVLSLFCGTQNILWVGTDMHGVWQLSEKIFDFGQVSGLPVGNAIRCFSGCGEESILVGTKGSGIFEYDSNLNLKRSFTKADGLAHNSVFALTETPDVIWIGTDGDGLNYMEKDGNHRISQLALPDSIEFHSVYAILPQGRDTLWVGTSGSGLFRLILSADNKEVRSAAHITEKELGSNVVYSILPDKRGSIIVGTRGGGISLLECDSLISNRSEDGYDEDILCMIHDSKGRLWAGSSMGLMLIDPEKGLRRYSLADGMPSQTIHGILEDASGKIWASTNNGIACLDPETDYILTYYAIDGLQDNEFSDGASFSRDGLFFFGGIKGFNRFDPLQIRSSSYDPKLVLRELRVDNELVLPPSGTLKLAPGVMSVSFTFTPVDYITGDRCMLAYKVNGFHKDWIQIGNSRTVALSNIMKPGNYTLDVYWTDASHMLCDDRWELPILVQQVWWKSNLAIVIYILLALAIFLMAFMQWQHSKGVKRTHDAKLDFFTNIAHEFSNSLSLIYGPCQELRHSSGITGKDMRNVLSIESNSNRMLTLIQQLINFRKAETGHLKINIGRVDMVALVYNVYDNFREQMNVAGIRFSVDAPSGGLVWTADGDSMEKVVFNLLSNAVKYTPRGQMVEVKLYKVAGRMIMDVTNFGVGIPKDKQSTIFNRYDVLDRFEKALQKGRTSNGIGLALCQSLVELHHGHIRIISDGVTSTTFRINMPQLPVDDTMPVFNGSQSSAPDITEVEDVEQAAPEETAPSYTGETILIVDDDEKIRAFLAGILTPRFNVVSASDGAEALELMTHDEPKIVVADLAMPGMDGLQLRKKMREDKRLGHIPFILLTGEQAVDIQIKALESGVDAYISKPFHPRHLMARIERLLNRDSEVISYSQSAQSSVEQYAGKQMKKTDRATLTAITEIILSNLDKESLNADTIAEELSMSKVQLYRKLKAIVGMTTTEFIRSVRLDQARYLLKTSSLSVQEVMYACGFVTKTYFFREFQKRYGLTPGEFRKNEK